MPPEEPKNEVTADLVSLVVCWPRTVDRRVREVIATWTEQQCDQADAWAGALHLRASDNDDVDVPAEPAHVYELRRQVQVWRGDTPNAVTRMGPMPARS